MFCIISFLACLGEFLAPILCKSMVKQTKLFSSSSVCSLETQSFMTIYRTPVPNYVIITSLSHFDHVFKMREIADEPDEYLLDAAKREVQFQTQKFVLKL